MGNLDNLETNISMFYVIKSNPDLNKDMPSIMLTEHNLLETVEH